MASVAQLHAQMRVLREQRDLARAQAEQLREQRDAAHVVKEQLREQRDAARANARCLGEQLADTEAECEKHQRHIRLLKELVDTIETKVSAVTRMHFYRPHQRLAGRAVRADWKHTL